MLSCCDNERTVPVYVLNIIDHAAEPMQQSIIVVRQLMQYLQTLIGTMQQQPEE